MWWVGKVGRVLEPACRINAQMELISPRNTSHKHDSKNPKSSMVTLTWHVSKCKCIHFVKGTFSEDVYHFFVVVVVPSLI